MVNMNFPKALQVLQNSTNWLRVDDENCIHSFEGDFYFILCRYKKGNELLMRLRVDNTLLGNLEIIKCDYMENSIEFRKLNPIYENAKKKASLAIRA